MSAHAANRPPHRRRGGDGASLTAEMLGAMAPTELRFDDGREAQPKDVETWLVGRGFVARVVGVTMGNAPAICPEHFLPRGTDQLYDRLRRAGAVSIGNEMIALQIKHGYPIEFRYRASADEGTPLVRALESDPVQAIFMQWYVAYVSKVSAWRIANPGRAE